MLLGKYTLHNGVEWTDKEFKYTWITSQKVAEGGGGITTSQFICLWMRKSWMIIVKYEYQFHPSQERPFFFSSFLEEICKDAKH